MVMNSNEFVKKNLILEQLDTFLVEYNVKTTECFVDPVKEKFIKVPWNLEEIKNLMGFDKIIFRPDIPFVKEFLDFTYIKPSSKKRNITVRLFVEPHKYQWFRISQICFFDENEELEKIVFSLTNTDEKTEMEQSLKFHSERDPLTHLPNINSFTRKVMEIIQEDPTNRYEMIRMDVECFRTINEMFGTKEGDNLLTFIGVRIQECLDEEEAVAYCRASSDVFLMCVPIKLYSVNGIIKYLKRAVMMYPRLYELRLTFGVYYITQDDVENMVPVNIFIDRAAAAQATVKGNYLHNVAYYNEGLEQQEKKELMIVSDMQKALLDEQFEVVLQPKVDMVTNKIVGSEALTRWNHPTKGLLMPGEFIPVFEKNGFIIELDEYVIKHTCRIIRDWLDRGITPYPVSVNLSRTNLYNSKIISNIEQFVTEYAVPREYLEFELTESGFAVDNNRLSSLAQKLRKRGYKVYMDDFGSGYSSLNALREICVDVLKIDLRFLPTAENDKKANTILEYVVKMANALEMEIVVEGIENDFQANYMVSLGCNIAQGHYYYKPLKIKAYEEAIMKTD